MGFIDRYRSPSDMPRIIPVFPLSGALLLPRADLPLNIFEPRYIATYNLIAEFYAPKRQDEKLFDEMTQKVLDAPVDIIPELAAEAAIEKRKAESLQKRKADGEFPF